MDVIFYTLLYVDTDEKRQLMGKIRSGNERIKIFLRNAAMLNKSLLEFQGLKNPLVILTNNVSLIERLSTEIGYNGYEIRGIPFNLDVPKGIAFYSAHFKIDVFRYLSTLYGGKYSILIDNDVVLLNKFPQEFANIINVGSPMCYRLNYDIDRIMNDARIISPFTPIVEWCGGEFIGGTSDFWSELYSHCMSIAPSYFKNISRGLFHVGDEFLTSLAIAEMTDNGRHVIDAGMLNIVRRYWGVNEIITIDKLKESLIHLPADKVWIASRNIKWQFTPPRIYKIV